MRGPTRVLYAFAMLGIPLFLLTEGRAAWLLLPPAVRTAYWLPATLLALVYWLSGSVTLLFYAHRLDARLLFLASQTLGLTLWAPFAFPDPHQAPFRTMTISVFALHATAPLLLHLHLSFPRLWGAVVQRRRVLGAAYGLAAVNALAWLPQVAPWWAGGILLTVGMLLVANGVLIGRYRRGNTPAEQRHQRIIVVGTALPALTVLLGDLLPTLAQQPSRLPTWGLAALLAVTPLSYAYAITRGRLLGLRQWVNRALVYLVLSLTILTIYLVPFILFSLWHPLTQPLQLVLVSALTLLVGASFQTARRYVQQKVDRLLYGGWYDFPTVVEGASAALQRASTRAAVVDVLARQVPAAMKVRHAHLWLGEATQSTPPRPAWAEFEYAFHLPARWWVGSHGDGEPLSALDIRILHTVAAQAEIALSNVALIETLERQLEEIRASQQAQQRLQHQLLRSREAERARLARDIHDGPIQALVSLNLRLGLLGETGDLPPEMAQAVGRLRGEVRELIHELRLVCTELRPPMLDTLGLAASLRTYGAAWEQQYGLPLSLHLPEDEAGLRALPDEVAVNLFRIAQEALTNIARHAQAAHASLALRWDGQRLEMTITDDGQGFAPPAALNDLTTQGHFGLAGIRERVELIGGRLTLTTAPGEGTHLRVQWPWPDAT